MNTKRFHPKFRSYEKMRDLEVAKPNLTTEQWELKDLVKALNQLKENKYKIRSPQGGTKHPHKEGRTPPS